MDSSQQTCKTRLAPTRTTDTPLQLCTSMTNTQDHEDTRNQQHTMTFFTMHQLDNAINPTQNRQSWRHESCTCRDDQAQNERHNRERKKHFLRLYTKVIKPSAELPRRWRDMTIKVINKSGDPSSHSAISSSNMYNPHLTRATLFNKQAPDQANPRRTTCTHSSTSDRGPPIGTSRFGCTTAYGVLCDNKTL